MRVVEVSYNNNQLMLMEFTYFADGKRRFLSKKLNGSKAVAYLNSFLNKKITGRQSIEHLSETVIYDDVAIRFFDFDVIRQSGMLSSYYAVIDRYDEERISKLSPKVKRKNKYTGIIVISSVLLILSLTCTGIVALIKSLLPGGNPVPVPEPEDTYTSQIYETPSSETPATSIDSGVIDDTPSITETIENPDVNEEFININYEDRSDSSKAQKARELYADLINKYANRYGLSPELVLAIGTQERGVHSSVMDPGGATGLMQIQNAVWVGEQITAYNFETGEYETVYVTLDSLADCEKNIKFGCMILQGCMRQNNYNIILGVQAYNMGTRGAGKAVTAYADASGLAREDVINNMYDCGWLDYREGIAGDPLYVEHVLSYIGSDIDLYIYKLDGTIVSCTVKNCNNGRSR